MITTKVTWPQEAFAELSERLQSLADSWNQEILGVFERISSSFDGVFERLAETSKQWVRAHATVCAELPKRGWYLTGQEPITLLGELAHRIEAGEWAAVDQILVEQAADLRLDNKIFQDWLEQQRVPSYCAERVRLVLEHRDSGSHEIATIVGMTVIDELCRNLYGGRDFTSKRNKQPRPQVACATSENRRSPSPFAMDFIETFGMIHGDTDPSLLEDENYFNRAAILHGQMRRQYGPKDSAKQRQGRSASRLSLLWNLGVQRAEHVRRARRALMTPAQPPSVDPEALRPPPSHHWLCPPTNGLLFAGVRK